MSLWRKRLARLRRNPGDAWLLARVVTVGSIVHPLVHRIGVARTARLVRPAVSGRETARDDWQSSRRVKVLVGFADPKTSQWTEGACLERSLILYRLLNLEGIPVDLMIGLRSEDGAVDGHAWLSYRGSPVLEPSDPRDDFSPTLCFPSPYRGRDLPFPQIITPTIAPSAAVPPLRVG